MRFDSRKYNNKQHTRGNLLSVVSNRMLVCMRSTTELAGLGTAAAAACAVRRQLEFDPRQTSKEPQRQKTNLILFSR